MFFCVESVVVDDRSLELCKPYAQSSIDNIFTLVIGQNATGKSRLLRKIASHFIFDKAVKKNNPVEEYFDYKWQSERGHAEVSVSSNSARMPANVIAVSTGRYDRFPSPVNNRESSGCPYIYIGPGSRDASTSLTSSLVAIMEGLLNFEQKPRGLAHILNYLDFAPWLDIKLALTPLARRIVSNHRRAEIRSYEEERDYVKNGIMSGYSIRVPHNISPYLIQDLLHYFDVRKNGLNLEIDLTGPIRSHGLEVERLLPLLKEGLLSASDISLFSTKTKDRIRLSQASSGQQCMLTMVLGIAGSIKNGSLICIDEPEISLHPAWQSDIVKQLQNAFVDYCGCHFIIATHSPQIVSGLTSGNGYVLTLKDGVLYSSSEYSRRSSDFQLAEIFNAPGYNNEYLIRVALTILTKVSRRECLSESDLSKFRMLENIKDELADTDPVYHLIEQIEVLRQ